MSSGRKLLFVIFRTDFCAVRHIIWYADALRPKNEVAIILEGAATGLLNDPTFAKDFEKLAKEGVLRGACKAASNACCGTSCAKKEGEKTAAVAATEMGIPLLSGLNAGEAACNHADITPFINDGWELTIV